MDLRLSTEQEQLVATFRSLYGRMATTERVRVAEPLGFDASLWRALLDVGVVAMAVSEERGGWGADLVDLGLAAEEHGRAIAPAPLVEAQIAARVLARAGDAGAPALRAALAGERLITVAPRPARGDALSLVPAGAVADDVIARRGDEVVIVELEPGRRPVENLGSLPLADLVVPPDALVLAGGAAADALWAQVLDEWCVLTAAALVGIAARALEIGVDYAGQRHAFGVPIGTFQAVSHPLADSAAAIDGARLLTWEAAWATQAEPARAAELAAMAFVAASEAARDVTYRSLHVHGGYGFIMEQDIQLYYRRARAWAQVLGAPDAGLLRVADRRYGPAC